MSKFGRTISNTAMDALRELTSEKCGWWPDLLRNWAPSGSSGPLRLAVRNGYLNFYAKGQSVAKITFGRDRKSPTLHIHQKYTTENDTLSPANSDQKYVKFDAKGKSFSETLWYEGSRTLDCWILRSSGYFNDEKRHIDCLVEVSPTVIDLEMGLPAYEESRSALRIDIVSLERKAEDFQLVFSEAKMISDRRLRSRDCNPEVLRQIERYRKHLDDKEREKQISSSYRECCKIIREIHSMASELGPIAPLDPLIVAASGSRLRVDKTLRLIVFDDGKKRQEAVWQEHLKVLERHHAPAAILSYSITTP